MLVGSAEQGAIQSRPEDLRFATSAADDARRPADDGERPADRAKLVSTRGRRDIRAITRASPGEHLRRIPLAALRLSGQPGVDAVVTALVR
jgi:hypothetical protein